MFPPPDRRPDARPEPTRRRAAPASQTAAVTMRLLLLSPHPDDIAWSLGGTVARLGAAGADLRVLTFFGRSRYAPGHPAHGEAETTRVRALEEETWARAAGVRLRRGDLPDASLRGYDDDTEMGAIPEDAVIGRAAAMLRRAVDEIRPDVVLAPLAVGGHVDHAAVRAAVTRIGLGDQARRGPTAHRRADLPAGGEPLHRVPVAVGGGGAALAASPSVGVVGETGPVRVRDTGDPPVDTRGLGQAGEPALFWYEDLPYAARGGPRPPGLPLVIDVEEVWSAKERGVRCFPSQEPDTVLPVLRGHADAVSGERVWAPGQAAADRLRRLVG
ncbi:LmbE family N-acetylglucosaminyl deacetylase [Actinoalloteichus hoggarensis]|uniref:2'-N-acetylparomamine deacetylase n=1 Tax=Actinoalloteichus hoggarensis TaxID=1470176 RepID=A0A221VYT8_9PSEU|nr:PIG-L family deacetylase [Actinoalloteichus hoggarensis]ASO18725.1 2'-N-acetylparomamine deacetylase [Actinoalloteichus hoggarensis]MBB5919958.1 LmbE family N-acetylglucosaminyl deacetylase [Actinoalloteichus hoggarensis]